jgi:hypothetical protein
VGTKPGCKKETVQVKRHAGLQPRADERTAVVEMGEILQGRKQREQEVRVSWKERSVEIWVGTSAAGLD